MCVCEGYTQRRGKQEDAQVKDIRRTKDASHTYTMRLRSRSVPRGTSLSLVRVREKAWGRGRDVGRRKPGGGTSKSVHSPRTIRLLVRRVRSCRLNQAHTPAGVECAFRTGASRCVCAMLLCTDDGAEQPVLLQLPVPAGGGMQGLSNGMRNFL